MKRYLVIALMVLLMGGCFYVDVENYEVDIQSDYDPEITISTNLEDIDTISVADSLFFTYNIKIDTGRLYFTEVYLNYTKIYQSTKLNDSISFFPGYFVYPGYHSLTLIAYFKSYNGSLADIYNADYLTVDNSWVLNYNLDNQDE